jgi:lipopolysaccharide export system permease protein
LKTLHKYITGQVVASLLLTVAVFAFVVLLVNVLKEVLPLLLGGHVPFWLVAKAVGYELPFACVYALPMGFITATLLVFGRFSADQELTAMRASGISLLALITPVIILSLLCCVLSAWLNMEVGPSSRVAFLRLKNDLVHQIANAQIPEGQTIDFSEGTGDSTVHYKFQVGKNNNGILEDVNISRMQNGTNWDAIVHATSGRLSTDRAADQLVVDLFEVGVISRTPQGNVVINQSEREHFNFSLRAVTNRPVKPKISDMTFGQLRQELRDLQQMDLSLASLAAPETQAQLQHLNLNLQTNATPAQVAALLQESAKIRAQQIAQVRVTLHWQVAFSFACFGFTLVGIPLGIRVHRRETNIGMALALGLVVLYYGFTMLGVSLAARPELYPHLILWLPNFIFQAVGAVLLWRANRGL